MQIRRTLVGSSLAGRIARGAGLGALLLGGVLSFQSQAADAAPLPNLTPIVTATTPGYVLGTWSPVVVTVRFDCTAANAAPGSQIKSRRTLAAQVVVSQQTAGYFLQAPGACVNVAGQSSPAPLVGPIRIDRTRPIIEPKAVIQCTKPYSSPLQLLACSPNFANSDTSDPVQRGQAWHALGGCNVLNCLEQRYPVTQPYIYHADGIAVLFVCTDTLSGAQWTPWHDHSFEIIRQAGPVSNVAVTSRGDRAGQPSWCKNNAGLTAQADAFIHPVTIILPPH